MITVAGCGGSTGGAEPPATGQVVRGNGFVFSAPPAWKLTQTPQGATATPGSGSESLVSVTRFRLIRPFRASAWTRAQRELDGIADRLARQLRGSVESRETVGTGVREYRLAYQRKGAKLTQRIRFVLRGRREYELLCRWRTDDGEPAACGQLLESFRLRRS
jgi:hypothetical protein